MNMNNEIENFFGIDFGTTSCATVGYTVMNGEPESFFYGDNEGRPVPSVVAINKKNGEVYIGREAWEKRKELSETCEYISSVKTLLDSEFKKYIAGKTWTPVMIAAELFKNLKHNVCERTGSELKSATVAIPVGFSAVKRQKLREAAKLADINITSFVSEPTAAFFANYNELKSDSVVTVFDWGGGTLDVAVLRNEKGKISELATGGMNVAGDDIDHKLARRLHAKIARKQEKDIAFEDMSATAQDAMLVRAERAKIALSDANTATVSINNYGDLGICREIIDYDWFEDIIAPEVNQAIACLENTIREAEIGIANVDRILLVGGSSNLRPLLDKLDKKYGEKIFMPDEEPEWNVGQGAALLALNPGMYCSIQSVGIVLSDGSKFELLKPDTPVKGWKRKCRLGIVDTSSEARFVFCGSMDIDEDSEKYRTLEIPAYRFLEEQIETEALVDGDMIFKVIAGSTMRSKEYRRIWEYTRLKVYYKLPEWRD